MFITVKHTTEGEEKITKYVISNVEVNDIHRATLRLFVMKSQQEAAAFDDAMLKDLIDD